MNKYEYIRGEEMEILKNVLDFILYPLVIYYSLYYARKSGHTELTKVEKFVLGLNIVALALGGWN